MDDFFVLGRFIGSMMEQERPIRILEISGGMSTFGHLFVALQTHLGIADGIVERISIPGAPAISDDAAYGDVLSAEYLDDPSLIGEYDCIIILDLQAHLSAEKMRSLLDVLQHKVTKQVLTIVPLNCAEGYRQYHPVVFLGLDFSYNIIADMSTATQAYSVFPKIKYGAMSIDHIPAQRPAERMNIAFALPHHGITGGMKALLQQIRHLTRIGQNVSVYYRSNTAVNAIPPWSDLTGDDYVKQTVIPASARFADFMADADAVVLGEVRQSPDFVGGKIPAVLWEQGSEAVFGDFGKPLASSSERRFAYHMLYRLPIHLIAVSDVIATVLSGIYDRDAFVYPNGIDTELYHPSEKRNDTPVVLLIGHPSLSFKGFHFAFDALSRAYAAGLRFQVKWAAQVEVIHGQTNFPLEITVSPTQHKLADMYRHADILFSPSLYESYSLPPLEAMASGTAVIATDCGGIRAYAKHGENCVLCRQGDVDAVVRALYLLINNPGERQRLAEAGRRTALEHSAETVVERLAERLWEIVHHHRQMAHDV